MARFKQIGDNPYLSIVSPSGEITDVQYSKNIGGGMVEIRGGKPRISDEYADQGYKFLSDLYASDPDEEIREHGFKAWTEYNSAVRTRKAERYTHENGSTYFKPFPEEWLPSAVLEMRSGGATGGFSLPKRGADKPKRGRPRADA